MLFRQVTYLVPILGLVVAPCFADVVNLNDGKSVSGEITAETAEAISIQTSSGVFTFTRSRIASIQKQSAAATHWALINQYLAEGKLESAALLYQDPEVSASYPEKLWLSAIVNQIGPTAAAVAVTSSTSALIAAQSLRAPEIPPELSLLTAALCLDNTQTTTGRKLLESADSSRLASTRLWPDKTLFVLIDRLSHHALAQQNGELLTLVSKLANQLPRSPGSTPDDLQIYEDIDNRIRDKRFLEAVSLITPDLFRRRQSAFQPLATKLITAILAGPDTESSLNALLASQATILPNLPTQISQSAYKSIVTRLLHRQRESKASSIADQLSATDPDTSALLIHLIEFHNRLAALPADSPLETYQLASWARSMGLYKEAKSLFVSLRPDPRFTETTTMQISLIDNAQAEQGLAHLRAIFDQQNMTLLQAEVRQFLETNPPVSYQQKAKDLVNLAEFQQWASKRTSRNQAEAEFQQAERLTQRGDLDGALMQLNRIRVDEGDSAAAQKAQELKRKISREKARIRMQELTSYTLPAKAKPPDSAP